MCLEFKILGKLSYYTLGLRYFYKFSFIKFDKIYFLTH